MVPKEELFLQRGEVGVGRMKDIGLGGKSSNVCRGGGEGVVDAARGGEVGRDGI